MTVHHCPKCELRFAYKTELDDHCWHDHPDFRHEYPVTPALLAEAAAAPTEPPDPDAVPHRVRLTDGTEFVRWLVPRERPRI